jgi:hypothetical protein
MAKVLARLPRDIERRLATFGVIDPIGGFRDGPQAGTGQADLSGLKLDGAALERNPINLDPRLASVSTGIFRLDGQLLLVIDVDRILDISIHAAAA